MGPWIGPDERKAAIAFLESKGMQRTRESVMRNAHLFGWLWGALES
jgi:hypothetical protein